jgi:hypothetical protein
MKAEIPGTGKAPRARSARTRKKTIESQAVPSCSSISSSSGTRCRRSTVETCQCAQKMCSHVWPSVQRLSGIGNGRCPTLRSERACRLAALASSKRSVRSP